MQQQVKSTSSHALSDPQLFQTLAALLQEARMH
jgi:hypothetical protein